jgi:nitrite reductase/ring-hydroxylating ferredoxin subunit
LLIYKIIKLRFRGSIFKDKELSVFGKTFFFKSLLLLLLIVNGCGKDKIDQNPYFSSVHFNLNLNLNLPSYDNLRYAGGGMAVPQGGINGLLIFNLNGNDFLAWEASCPNHSLKECSVLTITGVLAECSCEEFRYSLATGQLLNPDKNTKNPYPLLFYNVRRNGNTLLISN